MIIKDRIFLLVLASVGISIAKVNEGSSVKFLTLLTSCTVIITCLHFLLGEICYFGRTGFVSEFCYIAIMITICLIWCFFFKKRNVISSNVVHLNRFLKRYGSISRSDNRVKYTAILVVSAQFVVFILSVIEWNSSIMSQLAEVVSFGLEVHNSDFKNILAAYASCVSSLWYCAGSLLLFSAGLLWHRWSEVLCAYDENLRLISSGKTANADVKYADFFDILDTLQDLNQTFKNITFAVIVFIMQCLMMTVLDLLNNFLMEELAVAYYTWAGDILLFASFIASLVSFAACCSKIPDKLNDIQTTARRLTRSSGESCFVLSRELSICEKIEKERLLYVSACDMFDVSKGTILSAIGVTLTYGLLIINFIMDMEKDLTEE